MAYRVLSSIPPPIYIIGEGPKNFVPGGRGARWSRRYVVEAIPSGRNYVVFDVEDKPRPMKFWAAWLDPKRSDGIYCSGRSLDQVINRAEENIRSMEAGQTPGMETAKRSQGIFYGSRQAAHRGHSKSLGDWNDHGL